MENSKIAWTDHTFNPWIGCSKVSPGCAHCYAENLMDHRYKRVEWGTNGTRSRTKPQNWNKVRKWDKSAKKQNIKLKVFCASLADVFEERDELIPWRKDLINLIQECQNIYFLVLTKRPENIPLELPKNIWLGTSVENNDYSYRWEDYLSKHKNHIRFISYEPALGPLDISKWKEMPEWIIFGGESNQGAKNARPCDIQWFRDGLKICQERNVAPFVKQLGSNPLDNGYPIELENAAGEDFNEWPKDLQIRKFPI